MWLESIEDLESLFRAHLNDRAAILNEIKRGNEKIMADIDVLNQKLNDMKAQMATVNTSFSNELTAINTKLNSITSAPDLSSAIATAAEVSADLATLQANMDAETAALAAPVAVPVPPVTS